MSKEGLSFVPRVTQLDAVELDNEVMKVLKDQLLKAGSFFQVGLLSRWEPELEALLATIVWKLSVARSNATFGQQLLGLEFSDGKALALLALTVAPRYLAQRGADLAGLFAGPDLATLTSRALVWMETATSACSVANLACFVRAGRFATLPHRALRLASVGGGGRGPNAPGVRFLLRELLWHGFIELLVFVLPLVNWHWLRRRLRRPIGGGGGGVAGAGPGKQPANRKCPLCAESFVLPTATGCGHVFCYYCVQSHRLADLGFQCPLCGHADKDPASVRPWRPLVC